jgi:ribosome-associated toxin RatA of RatAB toxin-antitoxin module
MDISEINSYLQVLEGCADIEFIEREKHDVTGRLTIKFNGDVKTT